MAQLAAAAQMTDRPTRGPSPYASPSSESWVVCSGQSCADFHDKSACLPAAAARAGGPLSQDQIILAAARGQPKRVTRAPRSELSAAFGLEWVAMG